MTTTEQNQALADGLKKLIGSKMRAAGVMNEIA
jgi:hypothetical protein